MKTSLRLAILLLTLLTRNPIWGQTPVYPNPLSGICSTSVPHFVVNLNGVPDSVWVSPNVTRQATCCGDPGTGNWTFVSFNITLDPNVAMVAVGLSPSDPGGASSGYWIDACGTYSSRIEGGQEVCITGPGPHNIWYGKSGGNANSAYTIRQIPKPTFPVDDSVRVGCSLPLHIYGLNNITMTSHNSLYDSWLNLSNPSDPIFTPGYVPPSGYIDFDISGNQIASTSCGVYTSSATVRIYIFNALVPSVNPNPANFCQGGSVSLTASATGGVSPYTFLWYNNATNTIISSASSTPPINTAGTYTVYVSDVLTSGGCLPVGLSRSVTETLQPTINAGTDDTVCATSPTALLNASITNASGVVWTSPGGGTFSPSSTALSPSYTASATDLMNGFVDLTCTATGCVNNSDVVRIYFDAGPSAIINTPTLNCNNSTGIVSVSPSGGFGATSYYWSNGTTGSSQTFGAGTYSVTVVDAYGCGANHPFTLTSPSALSLVMSSTDETAPLAADGTASASPSGGTTPYSYLWNTSATSSSISGLSSAAYTVTVTDANGCSISGSTVVNLPICTGFNASASGTDVSCFGGNDGSATISFIGGAGSSGPYSYIWQTSPVQTTVTATGLTAGVYEVIVTDITLGCRSVATATVNQPTQLSNTMTHTDNSVIGGTSGTATANVSGGTPTYSYLWNNGQTSSTASGLAAGTYSVSITDANLCTISDNVIINEPPCNNFQAAVNTSGVLCFGESNGSATVVVAHGTAPYQYSLDGAAFIPNPSGTFTGLNGGAHTLNIMDASNCVVTQNFTINNPSALSVGLSPTSITCYGLSNGTIDLSVNGGTTPYSFEWINNNGNITIAHTEDIIGLAASTYSVTVTDANGCSTSASAGITMPSAISVTNITTDLTCNGTNDGAIDVTVSGGQSPYTYAWTYPNGGSSTNEDISSLSPGQYLLTVTDANFCTRINSVNAYVNEPAVVNIVNYTIDCPAPGNTFAVVTVDSISGGTDGPYQLSFDGGAYLSSGTYSTSLSINSTHTISAMDGNGCTTTTASTISIDPAVSISNVSFNPCIPSGSSSISVTVTPTGGDGGNYQISSDNGATFSALGVHTLNLPISQSYQIVARDSSGCNSLPYSITIPGELIISGVADSVACLNGNDGSILVSSVGGTLPYNISWTGPSSGNPAGNEITSIGGTYSINNLSAGVYTITTTDANSCTSSTTITVGTTVDLINPSISCPGTISTNNQSGLCSAVVNFGTPVGTDNCPGAITTQLAGLASGSAFPVGTTTNTFLVTDAQGRTATCSFDVTIIDAELPGISCPATINVNADAGSCLASSVTLGTPTTNDNCGVATITNNAPATFPVGTTTVTWTVTDIHGNSNTCTQTVNVSDVQLPTITCPATINVNADAGSCAATSVSLGTPVTSDNCGVASVSNNAPASFPVGTTTVTWTVTDIHGNINTCTQTVNVSDVQLPTITCPATVTVNADAGTCAAGTVSLGNPTTNDNCGIASVTNNAPASYPVGSTTVVWTVTDIHGNVATCNQTVIVNDTELPTIVCPAAVTVNADAAPVLQLQFR